MSHKWGREPNKVKLTTWMVPNSKMTIFSLMPLPLLLTNILYDFFPVRRARTCQHLPEWSKKTCQKTEQCNKKRIRINITEKIVLCSLKSSFDQKNDLQRGVKVGAPTSRAPTEISPSIKVEVQREEIKIHSLKVNYLPVFHIS